MSESIKFCPECGKQLPNTAKFCDVCGTNVAEVPPSTAAPAAPAQSAPPPVQTAAPRTAPTATTVPPVFRPSTAKSGSTPVSKLTKPLCVLLAVLLILTVLVNVARGALYRAAVRLNVEKLYDDIYNEHGRNNIMFELFEDAFYYTSNIRLEEAVEFFNSRKVKRSVQKIVNSVFDTMLTGNPDKIISEAELEKTIKSLASEINSKLGEQLTDYELDYVLDYIMGDLLYTFYERSDEYVEDLVEEFWEREAPKALRTLLHPTTRNMLFILDVLVIAIIILSNLKKIGASLKYVGIPLIVGGAFSVVLLLLTGVWAKAIAENADTTTRVARYFLSGYSGTAVRYAFMYILIGIILIVASGVVTKKRV